jgi:dienelactone hydrolase
MARVLLASDMDGHVRIDLADSTLEGSLEIPAEASGLVLFVHGSGSGRRSPRNQAVAQVLRAAGAGTLLFDLLTAREAERDAVDAYLRFDIEFLARRLIDVTRWVRDIESLHSIPIGYFGASTGAAAALVAAAELPRDVAAVVSRGGRPDLAGAALPRVHAATLLLVGSRDHEVQRLNQRAYEQIATEKQLTTIPGAGHLFEEPGTLDQVARHAADWFQHYLRAPFNGDTRRLPDRPHVR